MKLPDLMHATQVACPFHTKVWVYEEKIDGWRMLALKDGGRVRLVRLPRRLWDRPERARRRATVRSLG